MKRNRKMKMLLGLFALTLVIGTFAFFSESMLIENKFNTQKYGGETVEKFTPEKDWEAGETVGKEVQVQNTGDYPLYVRIKMTENWVNADGVQIEEFDSVDLAKFFPNNSENGVENGSTVYKNLVGVKNSSWIQKEDGYIYWKKALEPGEMTSLLMDSVTLCTDTDMGKYTSSEIKYAIVDKSRDISINPIKESEYMSESDFMKENISSNEVVYQKKTIELEDGAEGYAGAAYTLNIITEIMQADSDIAQSKRWSYIPE